MNDTDEVVIEYPKKKKITFLKTLIIFSVIIPIVIFGFFLLRGSATSKNSFDEEINLQAQSDLELVDLDLRTNYSFLSNKRIEEVKSALLEGHKSYPYIPIILEYAIIRTESDLRYWIEHPIVTLTSGKNAGRTVQCAGLGGIQWEQWDTLLIKNGIAEKRSDLFQIKENILASYFVIDDGIKKHIDDINKDNMLNIISTAYFGAGKWNGKTAIDYKQKLLQYTSELWMLKVAKDISKTFPKDMARGGK
ncbi:MAG: hypothetical protein RDU14_16575 [Melioribacteraceae bacterium]|nr:hypothetical protein [Melioribacteraceae bacterium]